MQTQAAETKLLELRAACMVDDDQRMGYRASEEENQLVHELLVEGSGNSHSRNSLPSCWAEGKNGHSNPYQWVDIIPLTPLKGGYPETRHNYFYLTEEQSRAIGELYVYVYIYV